MSSNSKNNTTTLAENKVLILYILNQLDNDIYKIKTLFSAKIVV